MFDKQRHEHYMKQILIWIFSADIWKYLAFKWWTLTYFKYNLDRFSTDVDLDLLNFDKEQEMINSIRTILVKIWEIKNETLWKHLHRRIFRYDERSMNIKVEINKRIWKNNFYEDLILFDDEKINCMDKKSIFTNKIVALYERLYNRDLYDVNFFFKNKFELNADLIFERTWLNISDFGQELINKLQDNFSQNSILSWLWGLINDKQKSFIKTKLLDETILQIKNFINLKKYKKW